MQSIRTESGNCVKCGQRVYVSQSQFEEDGKKYVHWSCKEVNKEEILKHELHNAIDVMSLSQLEALNNYIGGIKNDKK